MTQTYLILAVDGDSVFAPFSSSHVGVPEAIDLEPF